MLRRPAQKYETTWERIARAVRTFVDGKHQRETFQKLTKMLLLTYALRNADCHSKNLALLVGFKDTGKRMLRAWNEGVSLLREPRMYGLSRWKSSEAFKGISYSPKLENPRTVIGRLELLADRSKSPKRKR